MKAKKRTAKKATKKVTKKTTKKVTKKALKASIVALVKTAGKGVEKIEELMTGLVLDAFPGREYVRHSKSGVTLFDGTGNTYEYNYVFEVDESYYRISHFEGTGVYTIGPDDEGFDDNSEEISLTAKSIRDWVENFERKASGEEGAEGKKYEFTGDTKEVDGHILHRIRAVRKITDPNFFEKDWVINEGDLGGWIESEKNLSHEGAAWVANEACVYGDAEVSGNGYVKDKAKVYGHAKVYDDAKVYEYACVHDYAEVYDDAEVYGNANVYDNAEVFGQAEVCGSTVEVYGNAKVGNNDWVCGDTKVYSDASGEPEETTEPETEDTLKNRMAVLEGRVDTLADEMKATVKDIKDIKKKLNM